MKCNKCQTENPVNAVFCKNCGGLLQPGHKTCKNGHNFDASLESCPFCPPVSMTIGGAKTQVDVPGNNLDKTIIDNAPPRIQPVGSVPGGAREDKTMIYGGVSTAGGGAPVQQAGIRKLVGWLVTFDINPAGIDYKLSIGRHRIGKNSSCDIVLQQAGVSDEHAVLLYRDNKFILQDMLSTNGTYVNGVLIDEKVVLNNDDVIRIGNVDLKLKII